MLIQRPQLTLGTHMNVMSIRSLLTSVGNACYNLKQTPGRDKREAKTFEQLGTACDEMNSQLAGNYVLLDSKCSDSGTALFVANREKVERQDGETETEFVMRIAKAYARASAGLTYEPSPHSKADEAVDLEAAPLDRCP